MKDNIYIYYDEEGDFLEFNTGEYKNGYFRDVKEGISEWIDEETGKVTGFAIMSFRKRMAKFHNIKLKLPVKLEMIPA
ncbi:DUF2283 domain-containing protein [Candidatus Woesearchaeota archaeon]|nr:DUF2283 domain-containing protein [Candidatus Woesearchaeota archaeon]